MKVVLINPQIPWNSGNIGRTCVAAGLELVFVGKLGFEINSREIRRSGLDYWQYLKYSVFKNFKDFLDSLNENENLIFFSTKGEKTYWNAPYNKNSCLIFGSESVGMPFDFYKKYKDRIYKIPIYSDKVRSLNLSTSAGIIVYEALKHIKG